ncbi:hypothetical protein AKJ41_04785, partial [candidate division MSBL1 archaeon SCGC-AAA259O05]
FKFKKARTVKRVKDWLDAEGIEIKDVGSETGKLGNRLKIDSKKKREQDKRINWLQERLAFSDYFFTQKRF